MGEGFCNVLSLANYLSVYNFTIFSNVVEKCVSHSSRQERAMLIEEVCNMSDGYGYALHVYFFLLFGKKEKYMFYIILF